MNSIFAAFTPALLIGPLVSAAIAGPLVAIITRWKMLRKARANTAMTPEALAAVANWQPYVLQGFGFAIFMFLFLVLTRGLGH